MSMMKESLAARQAALLRQNAELDEKVEAMEQRRRQHQLLGTSGKAASVPTQILRHEGLSKSHAETVVEESDMESNVSISFSPPRSATLKPRVQLRMDLSASIDGSVNEELEEKQKPARAATSPRLDRNRSGGITRSTSSRQLKARKSERVDKIQENNEEVIQAEASDCQKTASSPEGLGLETTVRYQKARLRVLQDELDAATTEAKELNTSQNALKARLEELAAENATLKKKQQQTQQLLDKQQELSEAQESKQKILETQLSTAQNKIDDLQRAEKLAAQQFRSKDVRLNRALEELEKVKAQLQEERRTNGEQIITKSEYDQVVKESKRLEKQKNELLVAFKKQMKLIDLLKRQRIHMEAAKMLSFTEEEFSKTLELG
ncbi:hypothetical protein Poli38472_009209 [Pythium oligandrum]|uniref:Testis-expressed sequence 9 protein n=1 Tax=Pythium oligandrum TaxID=41045 RepID=A0A8K1FMN1_PYTOL|nr:hypothetical protein Poli38472_009209 [Pythium oligandrum]|eukprot:TMW65042.1 hypothetical protein Poli38472_009209 [Pythium oligandrum]